MQFSFKEVNFSLSRRDHCRQQLLKTIKRRGDDAVKKIIDLVVVVGLSSTYVN